jgi:hypothetical protein
MRYRITQHARARYVERIKPLLTTEQAEAELSRLLDMAGEPSPELPKWAPLHLHDADAWLEIAPGILCPLTREKKGYVVCSVLARAGCPPEVREARAAERRRRKAKRRFEKRAERQIREGRRPAEPHTPIFQKRGPK